MVPDYILDCSILWYQQAFVFQLGNLKQNSFKKEELIL